MNKIKITADTILAIYKGIFSQNDYTIQGGEFNGKTVEQALNIEYYTFKHRPIDTSNLVSEIMQSNLSSLNRSFCILSLSGLERVFSKDNDTITATAEFEFWIQSSKVKLLEDFIEEFSIYCNGKRLPVQIDNEFRKVIAVFSNLGINQIDEVTEFGEMAVCSLDLELIFTPNICSRLDYDANFAYKQTLKNEKLEWEYNLIPFTSMSVSSTYTQKSVPQANKPSKVGNINLSKVKTFVFGFDGYLNNDFIDEITKWTLSDSEEVNKVVHLKLARGENEPIEYDLLIKDHLISVQEDTGNETHSLTLTEVWKQKMPTEEQETTEEEQGGEENGE